MKENANEEVIVTLFIPNIRQRSLKSGCLIKCIKNIQSMRRHVSKDEIKEYLMLTQSFQIDQRKIVKMIIEEEISTEKAMKDLIINSHLVVQDDTMITTRKAMSERGPIEITPEGIVTRIAMIKQKDTAEEKTGITSETTGNITNATEQKETTTPAIVENMTTIEITKQKIDAITMTIKTKEKKSTRDQDLGLLLTAGLDPRVTGKHQKKGEK